MKGQTTCQCGCGLDLQQSMKWVLSSIEREMKKKFGDRYELELTCGARCEQHNKEKGGALNSAHLLGLAGDVGLITSQERNEFMKITYTVVPIKRREDRLLNHSYVHIDIATGSVPHPTPELSEYPQDVFIVLP